jgi:hypothetical protein
VLRKSSYKQIKDQSNKRKLQQSYPNKANNPLQLQASAIDDNSSPGTLAPEASFYEISTTGSKLRYKCDNKLRRKTLDIGSNVELL